jgi:hypothetical protein
MHAAVPHGSQLAPSRVLPARADSGRDSMPNSTTAKSLLLKGGSSFAALSEIAGALHLVSSQDALDCVGREIIEVARRARLSRQMELCNKASRLLLGMPVSSGLRSAAQYYNSLSLPNVPLDAYKVRGDLLRSADTSEDAYLPRILLDVGSTYDRQGDLSEAARY